MNTRLAVFCLALASGLQAAATDFTFTGLAPTPPAANANDWFNALNWSPNAVPGAQDTATIGSESTNGSLNGFSVHLTAPVTVQNLSVVASTLTGDGLTVNGTLLVKCSSMFNTAVTINGTMNVVPAIYAPQGESDFSCNVLNNGTVNLNSSALLKFVNSASTFQNNGPFNMGANADLSSLIGGVMFSNTSTFTAAANTTISGFGSTSAFVNSGTLYVPDGTLQLLGNGAQSGYVNSGIFNAGAGGVISVQGAATLSNGASLTGSGLTTLGNVSATGTNTVSGRVALAGGWTENGTLEIANGGAFTWQGGTIASYTPGSTSLVRLDYGGSLTIDAGGSTVLLLQTVIDNNGFIQWTNGGNLLLGNNAAITNEVAGVFFMECDGILGATEVGGNATAVFQNAGNFYKTAGATNDATTVALPFNCTNGDVQAKAGTLKFGGGSDGTISNALFQTAGSGIIEFSGGTHVLSGLGVISGAILADGAGLTVTPSSFTALSGNFRLAGGYLGGLGTFKVGTRSTFNWAGGGMQDQGRTLNYGTLVVAGGNVYLTDRSLVNAGGTITWSGGGNVLCSQAAGNTNQVIDNQAGGTFDIQNNAQINGLPTLSNEGLLKKSGAGGTTSLICNVVNTGTIEVDSGTLEMRAKYTDQVTGPPPNTGGVVLNNGGTIEFDSVQTVAGDFSGDGSIKAPNGIVNDGYWALRLAQIEGDLENRAALEIGDAPGLTTIQGNFTQDPTGNLTVPLAGTNAATPDFGQLVATGRATLAGTLQATIENGFAPAPGTRFQIISAKGITGTFTTLQLPAGLSVSYSNTGAFLIVTGVVPVQILTPAMSGADFSFGFHTVSGRSYTVQSSPSLSNPTWTPFTNFTGDGSLWQFATPAAGPAAFFRVDEP